MTNWSPRAASTPVSPGFSSPRDWQPSDLVFPDLTAWLAALALLWLND